VIVDLGQTRIEADRAMMQNVRMIVVMEHIHSTGNINLSCCAVVIVKIHLYA